MFIYIQSLCKKLLCPMVFFILIFSNITISIPFRQYKQLYQEDQYLFTITEFLQQITYIMTIITYSRSVLSDPGYVQNMKKPENLQFNNECTKCKNIWKPPRAYHCKQCQKCVFKMDHHCFWINNCVGAKNQKFFIQFLIYTAIYCFISICIIFSLLIIYLRQKGQLTNFSFLKLFVVIDFIFAVFFFIFSIDFCWDQILSIQTNQTLVETYKNKMGKQVKFQKLKDTFFNNFKKIFGNNFLKWFFPINEYTHLNFLDLSFSSNYDSFDEDQYHKQIQEVENDPQYNKYQIN